MMNSQTLTQTQITEHELDDLRAVYTLEATAEVNMRGETVTRVSVDHGTKTQRGWECQPCQVRFPQWESALRHLRQPRRQYQATTLWGAPQLISVGPEMTAQDIRHFGRELLQVDLTDRQIKIVATLIADPPRLVRSSRNFGLKVVANVAFEILKLRKKSEELGKTYADKTTKSA